MADERTRLRMQLGLPAVKETDTKAPSAASVDERAQLQAKGVVPTPPTAEDLYYVRDPKTGLSPAQVDAQKALEEAQAARQSLGLPSVVISKPGSAGQISTPPETGLKQGYEWYAFNLPGGGIEWRQKPTAETLTKSYTTLFSPTTTSTTSPTVSTTTSTTSPTITPAGPTLARDTFKNTLALFFGATEASKPWVNALYDVVNKYYRTGSSADESFNLALQDARNNPTLKPFTDRFKGIYALQDMRQAGKPVLVPTIAEYVSSQAKMGEILTQVGMGNLATEEFTGDLIGKGNSVTTIADRISQVFTRIDLAPKAIKDTLSRYFPTVDRTTLARTLLLGEKGTQQLVDELAQYEVLAAAEQQKLGAIQRTGGLTVERAGEYARLGETFQSLTPKFARIAEALPTEEKLAGISGVKSIGQIGLEQAAITGSYEAQKQLKQLTEEEEGRFAGRAGRFASRDRAAGII